MSASILRTLLPLRPVTQSSLTLCLLPSLALVNDGKSLLSPAARPVCTHSLLLAVHLYTVLTSRKPRSTTSITPPAPCSHVGEEEFGVNTQVGRIPANTLLFQPSHNPPRGEQDVRACGRPGWMSELPVSQSQTSEPPDPPTAFDAQPSGSSPPAYRAALVTIDPSDHVFFSSPLKLLL